MRGSSIRNYLRYIERLRAAIEVREIGIEPAGYEAECVFAVQRARRRLYPARPS